MPGLDSLRFDNAFLRELPGDAESGPRLRQVQGALWSRVDPAPVVAARLLAHSAGLARQLGLDEGDIASQRFADVFAGNALLEGMQPYASNYGGHQFGHWAGQLGDGRAIMLGEAVDASGERLELQLKGAGPTPYSRSADGRAVLRSSIREFLCSEAMHHLGVPTTRALSLVATGEEVVRDMFYDGHPKAEQGAIVCRVAPSFIRFGHFELPASRGDDGLLRRILDFTIRRDFPWLLSGGAAGQAREERLLGDWFGEVCERTARTVAHWMRVGFVHGVMNTDNMSILGLTIDYGPYGWIDDFDPDWTPNTTDAQGRRYRFGTQPQVAYWNLGCLAGALSSVVKDHDALHAGLQRYATAFAAADRGHIAGKLGLRECTDEDIGLMQSLQGLMRDAEVDMTIFFRTLADADPAASLEPFAGAFYDEGKRARFGPDFRHWFARLAERLAIDAMPVEERRARMRKANPAFVLRNYLAQQAINRAEQGDPSGIAELLEVMRRPYDDQPGREDFAKRRPEWARDRAGCSMLSCSS